jgi:hypothetical protein
LVGKWVRITPFGTEYHLIALFCTVAANAGFAISVATKFSNEINDLGRLSDLSRIENPSK